MPNNERPDVTYDVAVLGCGLMGAALARTLAGRGLRVAAWNRTHPRAVSLTNSGVVPVQCVDDAVSRTRLVLACTLTPEHTRDALAEVTDLAGTTVVFVGSGSPQSAVDLQKFVAERGGGYLDAVIMSYPDEIGTEDGMIVVSGSSELWVRCAEVMRVLGGASFHASEDIRAANIMAASFSGAFYVAALAAYVEGVTYAHGQGMPFEAIRAMTLHGIELLKTRTVEIAQAIGRDDHVTDQATIATFLDGAEATLASLSEAGYSARLIAAARENLLAAHNAGLSDLAFSAQFETLKS
jgi:3-hydroxyisobutyrate dehydrogenase-like beta-hydroxyacid dehydrogenase